MLFYHACLFEPGNVNCSIDSIRKFAIRVDASSFSKLITAVQKLLCNVSENHEQQKHLSLRNASWNLGNIFLSEIKKKKKIGSWITRKYFIIFRESFCRITRRKLFSFFSNLPKPDLQWYFIDYEDTITICLSFSLICVVISRMVENY